VTELLNDRCVDTKALDQLSINTIGTLAIDAVQATNLGHPGTPMALAPVAYPRPSPS
jgi:transketolase